LLLVLDVRDLVAVQEAIGNQPPFYIELQKGSEKRGPLKTYRRIDIRRPFLASNLAVYSSPGKDSQALQQDLSAAARDWRDLPAALNCG
jgi:hypothetical protein